MTEHEMLLAVLERLDRAIYVNNIDYMEFENSHHGESIAVKFNEQGEIVDIYC